jgi:hypothetical protein
MVESQNFLWRRSKSVHYLSFEPKIIEIGRREVKFQFKHHKALLTSTFLRKMKWLLKAAKAVCPYFEVTTGSG